MGDALGREDDWSDVDKQFAENINKEIIVMVGYPRIGKTTISENFNKDKYVVISDDKYSKNI